MSIAKHISDKRVRTGLRNILTRITQEQIKDRNKVKQDTKERGKE